MKKKFGVHCSEFRGKPNDGNLLITLNFER